MNSIARRTSVLFFFILGLTSAFAAGQAKPTPDLPLAQAPATGRVMETYGKMPLSFEANQGQTDPRVKFLSRGSGYTLFLTPTEAVLALQKPGRPEGTRPGLPAKPGSKSPDGKQPRLGVADAAVRPSSPAMVLRMKLVGGNRAAKIGGADELPGRSNYFIGKDPAKWRTNVSNYGKVQYRNVYPGVDLVYYGNQRQLEHDFVVAPGSDPKVIKLAFEGAKNISLNSTGDLVMGAREGEIQLKHPRVYQEVDGKRQEVAARYMLTGKGRVGFAVAQYDHRQPLVIDPVLSYSTYLGGSSEDVGLGIAVDSSGNAYVTGYTASTDFPTVNSLLATFGGGYHDAFVAKLNAAGSTLSYSTYLGGSSDDYGIGIAVDSSGNAYVTGLTSSTAFPTVNSLQATFGGGSYDGFVAKLNAAGSTLSYSTYLGGSSDEYGYGIAVDSSGNAYVTGLTGSTDFPTVNPLQASYGGGLDAFVAKIDGFVTTAASQSASTNEDTAKAITLSGSSANSCEITFSIVSSPSHGTLSALTDNACAAGSPNTDTANVTYSPAANYNGADSFTFKVNDGTTDSAAATVSLTVYPVNDAPSLSTPGNQTVITGNTLNLSLAATDVETPAAGLQYSSASLPSGATLSSAGAFSWTPTATQVGSYTVTFTVTDVGDPDGCTGALPACSAPLSDSKTITIKVIALQTISVTPVAPSLRKGFTLQFTATGAYSDASARNITSSVAWTSSKTSVATISAGGLALGIAPGKSTIKATSGSISGSTVLTVTSAQKPTR